MNLVFFGTPDFVIPVARSLLETKDCVLCAVVTNPDKPVGRNQVLTSSPVKQWAMTSKIKIIDSTLMIHIIRVIKKLKPDIGVLAAYGKIIPQDVIDLFPRGILVIHPSLLPKYRGASPVQAAILNGDKETGISIIKMDEKMDHGPIVAQFKEEIKEDDTTESLLIRLFQKTAKVLPSVIARSTFDKLSATKQSQPQNHSLATYTKLIAKEDGFILPEFVETAIKGHTINKEWSIRWFSTNSSYVSFSPYTLNPNPYTLFCFIRAMSPWPGAWTLLRCHSRESGNLDSPVKPENDKMLRLKILKAHLSPKPFSPKGASFAYTLIPDVVQLEGKKPVSWNDFQKGYPGAKF